MTLKVEIELENWQRNSALAARLSAAPHTFNEMPQRGDIVRVTEASGAAVDLVVVGRMCRLTRRGERWLLLCKS